MRKQMTDEKIIDLLTLSNKVNGYMLRGLDKLEEKHPVYAADIINVISELAINNIETIARIAEMPFLSVYRCFFNHIEKDKNFEIKIVEIKD